uniref:GPI inositol-deacylase n=1 Tax=Phytophthora ramorum TaxID=164328 RepID=H3GV79_PHYRM
MSSPLFILAVFLAITAAAEHRNTLHNLQNETMTEWPSLRFHFTIKRDAMQVHGHSEFSVLANPVVSTNGDNSDSVLYDTFATFEEDSMMHTYTLVDGIAYVSESSVDDISVDPLVKCVESGVLIPINSIVLALNEAVPVSSISSKSSGTIECSSGNTFKATVNGFDLGLCFSDSSGFTMYGNDMNIAVEYLESREDIAAPTIKSDVKNECEKVASASSVTSIGRSFLTGASISLEDTRELRAAFDFDFSIGDDDTCSCKSTPRPCIFIHGLGILQEAPENLDTFPTKYWGNSTVTAHAPCCSSIKFALLNTMNNSWTDDAQQQKVCDRVLAVSETSQGTAISDTIIITHSMGNLILAGAIASGKCSLDSNVSWVGLSAPMRGSMASNYFQDSCKNETNAYVEKLVAKTGYCPADDGIISLAYEGDEYSSTELDAAYAAAQQVYRRHVTAVMCSDGFSGLRSDRQWWYWVLGIVIPHKSFDSDGMVELDSCAGGFSHLMFGDTYKDRFYVTKLNHADTAFRNGDALFNKAKMPVKWFECLL